MHKFMCLSECQLNVSITRHCTRLSEMCRLSALTHTLHTDYYIIQDGVMNFKGEDQLVSIKALNEVDMRAQVCLFVQAWMSWLLLLALCPLLCR